MLITEGALEDSRSLLQVDRIDTCCVDLDLDICRLDERRYSEFVHFVCRWLSIVRDGDAEHLFGGHFSDCSGSVEQPSRRPEA
jgi:hypothetical protein